MSKGKIEGKQIPKGNDSVRQVIEKIGHIGDDIVKGQVPKMVNPPPPPSTKE